MCTKTDYNHSIVLGGGHGGIINNIYQTKGKRAYHEGLTSLIDNVLGYNSKGWFYEGVYDRFMVDLVSSKLMCKGVNTKKIADSQKDVFLSTRVKDVNAIDKANKNTIFLSFHCDGGTNPKANGFGTFIYTKPSNNSVKLANYINSSYIELNPTIKNRGTKMKNLKMVRETNCPAVLIECGFMTNYNDCKYLLEHAEEIAEGIVNGIVEYIEN